MTRDDPGRRAEARRRLLEPLSREEAADLELVSEDDLRRALGRSEEEVLPLRHRRWPST